MRKSRIIATIAAGLGVLALVPVATALGNDSGESPGTTVEAVTALGTSFTYQGRLTDGGSPANGTYDLRFILYDADTGGAQAGSTVSKEDVPVANGLFSVDLDFGASVFNGEARWIEIAVRPGSGSGVAGYTVLSPRQPVSPTPYALFAKAAGSLAVPFATTGGSIGAPASTSGLVTITQTGTGIAITGSRTSTDAVAAFPAVLGTNSGLGAGVQGESTNPSGVGISGLAANGTGGYFQGETGIEIDGDIKVSGSSPAAFVHTVVTSGPSKNTCSGSDEVTVLNVTDSDAIIFVTIESTGGGFPITSPVGVTYYSSAPPFCTGVTNRWVAYTTAGGVNFPTGTRLNILVIKR